MTDYQGNIELPEGNRNEKRTSLVEYFLVELPGTGTGNDASRYRYDVEVFGDYKIFLKRPTQLNKGFDFTVNIEGMYFKKTRKYSCPSHNDIFEALSYCKAHYKKEYEKVANALRDTYECKPVDLTSISASFIDYLGEQHPIQIIILAVKWLFMEQDCAYWNYSGRNMFYEGLLERGLV